MKTINWNQMNDTQFVSYQIKMAASFYKPAKSSDNPFSRFRQQLITSLLFKLLWNVNCLVCLEESFK